MLKVIVPLAPKDFAGSGINIQVEMDIGIFELISHALNIAAQDTEQNSHEELKEVADACMQAVNDAHQAVSALQAREPMSPEKAQEIRNSLAQIAQELRNKKEP